MNITFSQTNLLRMTYKSKMDIYFFVSFVCIYCAMKFLGLSKSENLTFKRKKNHFRKKSLIY